MIVSGIQVEDDLRLNSEYLAKIWSDTPTGMRYVKPDINTWSIAECMKHLVLIESSIHAILKEPKDAKIGERDPSKILAILQKHVPQRHIKVKSPQVFMPMFDQIDKNWNPTLSIAQNRHLALEIAREQGLYEVCSGTPHAIFGNLSCFEWLYFMIFHAERHIQQIREIRRSIVLPKD